MGKVGTWQSGSSVTKDDTGHQDRFCQMRNARFAVSAAHSTHPMLLLLHSKDLRQRKELSSDGDGARVTDPCLGYRLSADRW
ncbi:hypothetical protein CALVIDRAFT_536613 [Calocera viscosa TUFC12733]|uniref:Uncharacterized protein n=1 Tax=Calocera viscosa (strain TUFC12733) TaxID=1330018 RepID=A0A167MXB1_CALVF|nr:hypothetical protein CALVIDRAFT_536613 [Calocera viscosa TUFC12733]